jgi:hypothetical protein
MEPPTIPDNRPHKSQNMDEINGPVFKGSAQSSLRSNSPAGQAYEPQAFGQPAIGRPPMTPRQPSTSSRPPSRPLSSVNGFQNSQNVQNGHGYGYPNGDQFGRKYSIDQESVAESTATLDLGHHSIGQPQPPPRSEKRLSISSNNFDQRSLSNLSLDQQSIGNQSLGHHSIGGAPGGYYT